MSYKAIQNMRGPLFRTADIAVYVLLLSLAVALFIVFVFSVSNAEAAKIAVDCDDERVLICELSDLSIEISEEWTGSVETTRTENALFVTIYLPNGGYNVVEFTQTGASVTDANCSLRKDCVYSPAVETESGTIICVPHNLRIYAEGGRLEQPSLG